MGTRGILVKIRDYPKILPRKFRVCLGIGIGLLFGVSSLLFKTEILEAQRSNFWLFWILLGFFAWGLGWVVRLTAAFLWRRTYQPSAAPSSMRKGQTPSSEMSLRVYRNGTYASIVLMLLGYRFLPMTYFLISATAVNILFFSATAYVAYLNFKRSKRGLAEGGVWTASIGIAIVETIGLLGIYFYFVHTYFISRHYR